MQVGQLRHNVTIQSRSTAVDGMGQQVPTWTDVMTIWGFIEALSAREIFAAQAVQSEVTHRITVRYRPELVNPRTDAALRATYGGRLFNIQGAMNIDERNRVVELMVSEGLNNG